jgi:hypothetical protein
MATAMPEIRASNSSRRRLLTFPREHGAWGILLVPLATGAALGFDSSSQILPLILFTLAALALFCLRTPAEAWLATSPLRPQNDAERRVVFYSMAAYAAVAGIALSTLILWQHAYDLLVLGAIVAAIFGVQAVLKKLGRETRMSAQLIGAVGLTSTAAAAYYVATGKFGSAALVLWAVNWLFAANQIHFVQLRIHGARAVERREKLARGRNFLIGEFLTMLLLAAGWRAGFLPAFALFAFVPILLRGLLWPLSSRPTPLEVRRLGQSELAHAIAFGVLLILGFHFGGI